MTRRLRVVPIPGSALPGDQPAVIDLDASDRPGLGIERAAVSTPRRLTTGSWAVEVVVDGWRFELDVEDARRAELRRRATRVADATAASGPTEIRAIIPGRVAAVRVVAGDAVEAGQSLLVVEAMKMQNELRAPRAGTVARVSVGEGQTIDNGDLLVVLG
jgi:biotin carboxyl carrier protein